MKLKQEVIERTYDALLNSEFVTLKSKLYIT
jgi:hypothetical protein